jgi:hypothetical protein
VSSSSSYKDESTDSGRRKESSSRSHDSSRRRENSSSSYRDEKWEEPWYAAMVHPCLSDARSISQFLYMPALEHLRTPKMRVHPHVLICSHECTGG